MQDNKDKPKETDKNNLDKNPDKMSENKEFIESIQDRPEPKKKEQDFTRDYAITLNLGQDLEKKYKALELESKGKSEEELVNIRLRQLGLAKLLVKIHGRDAQILIKSNTHVGHAYLEYKCYEQSYNHLIQALEMRKEFYGANEFPQYHLYTLKLLAQTCLESNKVKEAIFYIEEGEEICLGNQTIGTEGRDYAQLLALKADFLYLNLKFTEAIECYEKVFETYSKIDGLKSEGCANCLKQIVKIHFQQGNYTEAILYVEECIGTFMESGAQNKDFQLYDLYFIKLEILNKQTDRDLDFEDKYVDCYIKIKDLSKSLYGNKDKRTLRALTNLVMVLAKRKRYNEAHDIVEEVEGYEQSLYGEKSNHVAKTYKTKANILQRLNEPDRAREYIHKSISIFEELGNKIASKNAREIAKKIPDTMVTE